MTAVDACLNGAVQLINDKVSGTVAIIEKAIEENKLPLKNLQESLVSLTIQLPPLSSAIERKRFLDNDTTIQQLTQPYRCNYSKRKLTGVYKWKSQVNAWLQSYEQATSFFYEIPSLNARDVMTTFVNR